MSTADRVSPHPSDTVGARVRSAEWLRFVIYLACLVGSFGLYLLIHGHGGGALVWIVAVLALIGMASGFLITDFARQGRFVRAAAALAAALAVAVPLGTNVMTQTLAAAIGSVIVWPQILVTLFASRVLAEMCELRFAAVWRRPFAAHDTASIQSVGAALALAAAITLTFYDTMQHAAPSGAMSGIVGRALLGDTAIHHAIIFLFFVIIAFAVDAGLLYGRDRAAIAIVRTLARERGSLDAAGLRRLLDTELSGWSHTRALRHIDDSLALRLPHGEGTAASVAATGFHQSFRRFVKGLVPLLPLLGFLGTVIGLATALAELPRLGAGRREVLDLSGSLAGLAIKFETTLLGLLGSMIASLVLSILEKAEAELAAEASLLVKSLPSGDVNGDQQ